MDPIHFKEQRLLTLQSQTSFALYLVKIWMHAFTAPNSPTMHVFFFTPYVSL